KLGARVGSFLQGELMPPPHTLPHAVSIYAATRRLDELVLPDRLAERVKLTLGAGRDECGAVPDPVCLVGPRNSGRKALCAALFPDTPLVVVNMGGLPREQEALEQVIREALCESMLQGGALYLDGADALGDGMDEGLKVRLGELLA